MTSIFATVGYFEPWWIQVIKGILIFVIGLSIVPVILIL
jgi:hypothetical protein